MKQGEKIDNLPAGAYNEQYLQILHETAQRALSTM